MSRTNSELPTFYECPKGRLVFAMSVLQESQAIARVVVRDADADVIQFAESQAVHLESSTANVASNLTDHVVRDLIADSDADDNQAVFVFRSNDSDRSFTFRSSHSRITGSFVSIGKRRTYFSTTVNCASKVDSEAGRMSPVRPQLSQMLRLMRSRRGSWFPTCTRIGKDSSVDMGRST